MKSRVLNVKLLPFVFLILSFFTMFFLNGYGVLISVALAGVGVYYSLRIKEKLMLIVNFSILILDLAMIIISLMMI